MSEPGFGTELTDGQEQFVVQVAAIANRQFRKEQRKEKMIRNSLISLFLVGILSFIVWDLHRIFTRESKYICGVTAHISHINGAFLRTETEKTEKQNKLGVGYKLAVLVTDKSGKDKTKQLSLQSIEIGENAAAYWKYALIPKLDEQAATCKV